MLLHIIGLVIMSEYSQNVIAIARYAQEIATGSAVAISESSFFEIAGHNLPSIRDVQTNGEQVRINSFPSRPSIREYYTSLLLTLRTPH